MNIGDKAEIQCSYTEFFLYLPNFIINGVTIESTNLKTQLRDYNQKHNWDCTDGCSAMYTLTLSNGSRGYNGTTYQCYDGSGAVKSGIVTLIVRGGHSLQTYNVIHTYILTHKQPPPHTHTNPHTSHDCIALTCSHFLLKECTQHMHMHTNKQERTERQIHSYCPTIAPSLLHHSHHARPCQWREFCS